MAQTVIGMFESSSKAQKAVQELEESGISRDRIDVSGSNTSGSSSNSGSSYSSNSGSSYSSSNSGDTSDHHESGISKFFKNLFGGDDDNDDADKYTRVASQAQSIVTVHAQSRDEAERVADILDDNGAVDVDEEASRMGYSGSGSYGGTGTGNYSGTGTGNYSGSGTDFTGSTSGGTYSGTGTAADVAGLSAGAGAGVTGLGADLTGSTAGSAGSGSYTGTGTGTGTSGLSDTGDTEYSDRTTTGTGYTGTGTGLTDNTSDETRKIPIIEENLEVGKREVRTGGVRVRSRIVERPVEESVRLREERVNVERNTVDRPATEADFSSFQERDIEMVERAEVPVVNKEARVVEEISIDKDVQERTETVQDTVRKTEVDVEDLGKSDLKGNRSTSSDL